MKIFQILGGFCHWDASRVLTTAEEAAEKFAPDMTFTEAPDYVFEGWGFDPNRSGSERFIRPTPPEGWSYDDAAGTFYPTETGKPSETRKSPEQLALENIELRKIISALEEQLTDVHLALCEMFENLINT